MLSICQTFIFNNKFIVCILAMLQYYLRTLLWLRSSYLLIFLKNQSQEYSFFCCIPECYSKVSSLVLFVFKKIYSKTMFTHVPYRQPKHSEFTLKLCELLPLQKRARGVGWVENQFLKVNFKIRRNPRFSANLKERINKVTFVGHPRNGRYGANKR